MTANFAAIGHLIRAPIVEPRSITQRPDRVDIGTPAPMLDRKASGGWQALTGLLEIFGPMVVYPDEFIAGGEHVVVPDQTRFRGRDGIEIEASCVSVATLGEGRIVAWKLYHEMAEALEAMGPSSPGGEVLELAG
jgi:hypothetical protein